MSVNHYSTDHHHNHTLFWQQLHTTDATETTTATWLNQDQKESLFEKTLTPSDVGKLNRLVIPNSTRRNTSLSTPSPIMLTRQRRKGCF
ncbi:hypothetical protein Bca52824_069804 [Brassica carinata]|uniref:Uncharacterized protein n=1 Tax=Brassica carinata TaxID=52824 RepID=A0A8X7U1E4_BRACI|nr:hypothetical protein Bca52824_069804 [Brassica carinata]